MFNALHLAGWEVLAVEQTRGGEIVIRGRYAAEPDACPECRTEGLPLRRGSRETRYADAPMFGRPTVIVALVRRYTCRACGRNFKQALPDMEPGFEMTRRCAAYIAEQALERTFADVGRTVGIAEKTVRKLAGKAAEEQLRNRTLVAPVVLGIDEVMLAGARRCIFTDVGERRILDLLPTTSQEAVRDWLSRLPGRERVRVVTIDMHHPYKIAARAELPDATIVVDKWHVQTKANDALDKVRSRLASGLRGTAKRRVMRGRRLLHARGTDLSPRSREVLEAWLRENEVLAAAWAAKESFYAIWDGRLRQDRERLLMEWHNDLTIKWRPVLNEFHSMLWTIKIWQKEVFAYFRAPFTNAYTEAANGLIKIANRAGRGYSFDSIRRRAILMPLRGEGGRWVCEGCLGQFVTDPEHLEDPESGRLCGSCAILFWSLERPRRHRGRTK